MNFTIITQVGAESRPLLVASKIGDRFYNIKELLGTSTNLGGTNVYVDSADGFDLPFLVSEDEDDTQDISKVYSILVDYKYDAPDSFLAEISSALEGFFTVEDLKSLERCFKEFDSYMSGNVIKIKIPVSWWLNIKRTSELVDSVNSSSDISQVYVEGENKTLYMKEATDEFFIRIPSYDELGIQMSGLPSFRTIYDPYAGSYIDDPAEVRREEARTHSLYVPPLKRLDFKSYLAGNYKMEDVIGNPSNNTDQLFDNEIRYYNGLKSLMDYAIQRENPNNTLEDCIEAHIPSIIVKDYITNVALMGIYQNWFHTGFVPTSLDQEITTGYDEDFDDTTNDSGDVFSNRKFIAGAESLPDFCDAASVIENLINKLTYTDVYASIKIAIMLNRFGSRKPTRIPLGNNSYLDMNIFKIVTGSGNYSATEVEVDEKGNNLTPIGLINMTDALTCSKYIKVNNVTCPSISMPVGLICRRYYKGVDEFHTILISFIDLYKLYEEGNPNCKVNGITFENKNLEFDKDVFEDISHETFELKSLCSLVNTDPTQSYQYLCYSDFQDAFFEKDWFDRKLSVLSLINEYFSLGDLDQLDMYSYDNPEELEYRIKETLLPPKGVISRNIVRYLVPIFLKASSLYEEDTLHGKELTSIDTFNYFKKAMEYLDYVGSFGKGKTLNSDMVTMNSFGSKITKEDEYDMNSKSIINTDLEGKVFYKIFIEKDFFNKAKEKFPGIQALDVHTSKAHPDKEFIIVGYLAKGESDYTLINPSKNDVKASGAISGLTLGVVFSNTMKKIAKDKDLIYKYSDVDAVIYYANLLNSFTVAAFSNLGW